MSDNTSIHKMAHRFTKLIILPAIGLSMVAGVSARNRNNPPPTPLTADGNRHLQTYSAMLDEVKNGLKTALPNVNPQLQANLEAAEQVVVQATKVADEAQKDLNKINHARGLVGHAKNKWIRDADRGIERSKKALEDAKDDAARRAAQEELEKWQKNREEGVQALAERQAMLDEALKNEAQYKQAHEAAQAALAKARQEESAASKALLGTIASVLNNSAGDATLAKGLILASATPEGLARFAQESREHADAIEALFNSPEVMIKMAVAGGAAHREWGNAAKIYRDIRSASPRSAEGHFHRLAIATSIAHARPIRQGKPRQPEDAPDVNVDPVNRYLHYETAYLNGELDPAFEHLTTWEMRYVVNHDAPDEMLQWGRTMLRNYRPDHIYNSDYGWRYVASVRTEVPYGSQNVKYDDPTLYSYQNIVRNGGVCGRRAFYGRFILRAFGIPTWGVTQRAHAAVGHWTPRGWVVVLGAGFGSSWWDRDEIPMSGNQFVQESKARKDAEGFKQVLRARWISTILGEQAWNDRRNIPGGFWSRVGLYQERIIAAGAETLGPLGQELAEANEREQQLRSDAVSAADRQVRVENGVMVIPSVAHSKSSGRSAAMKSFGNGMQLHMLGGFKAEYEVDVPKEGKYQILADVATVQTGQKFIISANDGSSPTEIDVPYTIGMWEYTEPVTLELKRGKNTIHVELVQGSRGVTVKDFILREAK